MSILVIATTLVRHVHRSCVFEEQANRIMASLIADQRMTRSTHYEEKEQCDVFGGDMPSCLECTPQPDQHSQDTHPDAAAGFEGDMSSTTECIPWSDQQSESLG